MKQITTGILAHVDAGKTTLSECLLLKTGQIRKAGRVDRGDTHLDTDAIERERGITIFSKQARIVTEDAQITLLDTPGHVDFCAETERTMQILDCAVLVISGTDGVQSHTRTLWKLLAHYGVPVFLYVNKMDLAGADRDAVLANLKKELSSDCIDFSMPRPECAPDLESEAYQEKLSEARAALMEEAAYASEELLEELMESGEISDESIAGAVAERKLFPVWFGSALKELLDETEKPYEALSVGQLYRGLLRFAKPKWGERDAGAFAARVYKIGRDPQGKRLTFLRVTGGSLEVKMPVPYATSDGTAYTEKVDQIRLYSGEKYEAVSSVPCGACCAVTGLTATLSGMGIGAEEGETVPVLEPVISRSLILPRDVSPVEFYRRLKPYEEEEPTLHILWNEKRKVIDVQIMGEVQIEVLTRILHDRYSVAAEFGEGRIIYKETVVKPVEGVGHYEPLRHYSEVHLLIEPTGTGSGVTVASALGTDDLDLHWQRLILTHVLEREHAGVLTGSGLTDVRITLVAGKAHLKHTEGGDFRQSVYRAIRQGLMSTECALLEPYYSFVLEIPQDTIGRGLSDLTGMSALYGDPEFIEPDLARITGQIPVRTAGNYMSEVSSYTKGRGRLSLELYGYLPCRSAEEVIAEYGYDPDADLENPSSSVFCAHGAGFLVPWDKVPEYMHLPYAVGAYDGEEEDGPEESAYEASEGFRAKGIAPAGGSSSGVITAGEDAELKAIYAREFGLDQDGLPVGMSDKERRKWKKKNGVQRYDAKPKLDKKGNPIYPEKDKRQEMLIVDGYNIIFAWKELRELAQINIDSARIKLLDILSNYQGFAGHPVMVVFDAYRTERKPESVGKWQNLTVVYTKENQTADAFIERTVHDEAEKYRMTVATSDGMEQLTTMRLGALRMSAAMLEEEIARAGREIREYL